MSDVRMILVGGFLGAGKTTLLRLAAERLAARGKRVGLITNDQAPDLVDTTLLARDGRAVREVAGSCFCCNFPALLNAAEELRHDVNADILIAEPVGSCTDLSATILQPLKDKFRQQFVLAPLTVLADPARLRDVLSGGPLHLHPSAAYIFRKQLEEADTIIINKTDLLSRDELIELTRTVEINFPGAQVRSLSALTGEGVDEWLDAMLTARTAGHKIVEVDYDTYAEGEAVLGWLNAAVRLSCARDEALWGAFCKDLLTNLRSAFQSRNAATGHVKTLLAAGDHGCAANLTRTDGDVVIRGSSPSNIKDADLIINARVEMSPGELERLVREQLNASAAKFGMTAVVDHLRCLTPGRPVPTHRYREVTG